MSGVALAVPLLFFAVCIYALWHNNRCYRARMEMIRRISAAAQKDIDEGRYDWQWRYDELECPSYMEHFRSLRRPTWPRDPARAER